MKQGAISHSSADWELDPTELESLFNPKTKAIIYNNPNNPLGKVYQKHEIEMIADLCKKHKVLCISDDVYEHMVRSNIGIALVFCATVLSSIKLQININNRHFFIF